MPLFDVNELNEEVNKELREEQVKEAKKEIKEVRRKTEKARTLVRQLELEEKDIFTRLAEGV